MIGRNIRCDVRIPVPSVAGEHCELVLNDDELTVIDLGSTEGTMLNGQPVTRSLLKDRDRLKIGPVTLELREEDEADRIATSLAEVKPDSQANRTPDRRQHQSVD